MGYLMIGMGGVSVFLAGLLFLQTTRLEEAVARNLSLRGELATCGGRLQNILDDVRSDNEIDSLTDDDLRNVPPEWLLPAGDPGDP